MWVSSDKVNKNLPVSNRREYYSPPCLFYLGDNRYGGLYRECIEYRFLFSVFSSYVLAEFKK